MGFAHNLHIRRLKGKRIRVEGQCVLVTSSQTKADSHKPLCHSLFRKQVSATKAEAEKDGVKVPTTLAEYCIKTKVPSNDNSSDLLYDNLYDDDIDDEDEEEEDADCYDDDNSGNEES